MQNKIYFLLVVFLLFVVRSASIDLYSRKGGSVLDYKNYGGGDDDDDSNTYKPASLNDDYSQASTQRRNRYSPYGSSSNNYRSRSRWPSSPSSYDERVDSNDWSQYGYGFNNPLINFPGPLPPAAFDGGPYLSNGPSCYSLLDPQYPLFSDICGAVPQARYSLPNSFGHIERWQIAQILTAILGPSTPISTNPVCTRSLRLLLCPLLFPPCPTRYEAPPVLPCQSFCRVVKNQCASPSLDLLPCDLLPPVSDLCPINPTPYSSLLSSFGPPLPFNGGLLPPGLPQSALSSILAQSAFSSGLSPLDIPPPAFSSMFSPSPYSPGSPSPYSPGSPSPYSQGSPSPYSQGSPSPYSQGSPSLYPQGSPSLYPQGSPSLYSPGSPSPYSSALTPSGLPPGAFSSLLSPSALSLSPLNPLFNTESYMGDSLTPILVDFPPIQYAQNYRPTSRYFPATRSATEKV